MVEESEPREVKKTNISWGIIAVLVVVTIMIGSGIGYFGATMNAQPQSKKPVAIWDLTMVGSGSGRKGPVTSDPNSSKTHDTTFPCNFTLTRGQPLEIIATDFDDAGTGTHSIASPSLGLEFHYPQNGIVAVNGKTVTYYWFNATAPGTYRWWCMEPCDAKAGGWDMTNGYDGQPCQIGWMGGFITVL